MRLSRGSDINVRSVPQLVEYASAADRIAADGPGIVLDWGCGLGQMTRLLVDRGVEVRSIEWVESLNGAQEQPLPVLPDLTMLTTSEPVALPYPDHCFDAVLSMGVLEHVHDPDASLDELRRVLKPGGTLYCYKLPNAHSWLEAVARRVPSMWAHGDLPYDKLYTLDSAVEIFERHGYTVVEAKRANMLPLMLGDSSVMNALGRVIWAANRALSRVPGLNRLATNVQVIARVTASD